VEAKILSGRDIASEIRLGLKNDVEKLKGNGVQPGLAVIIVGDEPAPKPKNNIK
jgi:methylenetetrahydrofolate dehydrogenase (NADP+)/methenyltetrahydrofolate cyclohydrolase